MHNHKTLFCIVLTIFCVGCSGDFFTWFSTESDDDSSDQTYKPHEWLAYCNEFSDKGFRGILTAFAEDDQSDFNTNKAWLHLSSVPDTFPHPRSNFIQFHLFNVENNEYKYGPHITMDIVADSDKEYIRSTTAIDNKLLRNLGLQSITDLIHNYGFVLNGLDGWEGVSLSVFDEENKPILSTNIQVLTPPFLSNPRSYSQRHDSKTALFKLHPFHQISEEKFKEPEKVFYEKAIDICEKSHIRINIPTFEEQAKENTDEAEEILFGSLMESLSEATN